MLPAVFPVLPAVFPAVFPEVFPDVLPAMLPEVPPVPTTTPPSRPPVTRPPVLVVPAVVPVVVPPVVVVPVVVPPVVVVAHPPRKILLLSSVTEPLRASARPSMFVPVVTLIEVRAMMVPTKVELVPRVAELPTCQNTLHAEAPFVRSTRLEEAVVRASGIWNTQTAFGFPAASRIRSPVSPTPAAAVWTPGSSV